MEKRILHRTTIGAVGVILVIAVVLGVFKGEVISNQNSGKAHDGQKNRETLNAQAADQGSHLFKNKGCAQCHVTDSAQKGIGPSLKGLFKRKGNLVSGRPVTEKNVREQIKTPYKNMPPFKDRLNKNELDQLVGYLTTL
jgi:mono/diheme cytochrome c family protein